MANRIFDYLRGAGASMRAGGSTFRLFPSLPEPRRVSASVGGSTVVPSNPASGWERDAANIRGDWERIGGDLRVAYRKYDETYGRTTR